MILKMEDNPFYSGMSAELNEYVAAEAMNCMCNASHALYTQSVVAAGRHEQLSDEYPVIMPSHALHYTISEPCITLHH